MRLLFVRHGDPDYEHDSLTEQGRREAQLLIPRFMKEEVEQFYVSPLGRAQQTASPTLAALGRGAITLSWLQEFTARVDMNAHPELLDAFPDTRRREDGTWHHHIAWDVMPAYWTTDERCFDPERWRESYIAVNSDMCEAYDEATAGLDELLAQYGYIREGRMYRTDHGRNVTLALFCHFGITAIFLSHLWHVSPFVLLHGLAVAPTSVTEVVSEERAKGEVFFRANKIGDISHLYAAGEQPSFSARFCEVYENDWQRH